MTMQFCKRCQRELAIDVFRSSYGRIWPYCLECRSKPWVRLPRGVDPTFRKRQAVAKVRARAAGVHVGMVSYRKILERDGWICHICGDPVLPDEIVFDHLVPLAHGGPHIEANISPAHESCNAWKKDRLGIRSAAPPRRSRRKATP